MDGYRHLPQVVEWNRAVFDAVLAELRQAPAHPAGRRPQPGPGQHQRRGATACGYGAKRVLWLDAHADFNTSALTPSGNVHGMPVACLCGFGPRRSRSSPACPAARPRCGRSRSARSASAAWTRAKSACARAGLEVFDMRFIDEVGMRQTMLQTLSGLDEHTHLHVSFDVDFLDPTSPPAWAPPCPAGRPYREAQLCMEMIADSGCLASLDIVEQPRAGRAQQDGPAGRGPVESLFGKRR